MLLYIHVPFCRRKCSYCAFASQALPDYGRGSLSEAAALWEKHLLMEMELRALELGRPAMETVFFGGGTPSLLPPESVGRILDAAARNFTLAGSAEVSMEANPDSVTREKASVWLAAGVNRISLGIQALDDRLLASIGRIHSAEQAVSAYRSLREAGCSNVGMDLIWGLPGETRTQWRRQLEQAAALEPDHLSCYGLTLEEGTPLYERQAALEFPGEEDMAGMYLDTGEILAARGYARYEISNHARPGRECRHNLGYWNGLDYVGLGPAAVGTIGAVRRCNRPGLEEWASEVCSGGPVGTEEHLSFHERAEEYIMLRLRTAEGLPLDAYRRLCGREFDVQDAGLLEHGLAETDGRHLRLTAKGMLVSNAIISRIFEAVPDEDPLPHAGGLPFAACSADRTAERTPA